MNRRVGQPILQPSQRPHVRHRKRTRPRPMRCATTGRRAGLTPGPRWNANQTGLLQQNPVDRRLDAQQGVRRKRRTPPRIPGPHRRQQRQQAHLPQIVVLPPATPRAARPQTPPQVKFHELLVFLEQPPSLGIQRLRPVPTIFGHCAPAGLENCRLAWRRARERGTPALHATGLCNFTARRP